ncbi:hypothetical protein A2524_02760 [Candidatus Wolfebacteria bacterium RIFOXYD12_FULL_48_21]|nr:MAG: hypothetical protein A2524_02760 [Candidatus Wolfebacteria bacterium RIFOXYD12_FULL_48_21]
MINAKPLIISRTLPHLGGRERIVQSLINYFKKDGLIVVTPDELKPETGVTVVAYKEDESLWDDMIGQLEQYDFNVIHCHTFYLADFAIKAAAYFKVPLVFTLHGVFFDFYGDKYNSIIKRIADNSTIFATVSDQYRRVLQEFVGDESDIEYVPNGIAIETENEESIDRFNEEETIVAVPARFTKLKGLEYLIEALPLLKAGIQVHVCSPAGRKVEEEIRFKNDLLSKISTTNVYFHEFDNDRWMSFLKKADIVLLPSLIEGQSLALLEAMSQEKLVVATNVGGSPEIISHGINGFIIEPKSPCAIAETLEFIIDLDESAREKMRNNASQTVSENFSFEKMVHAYISLYEKAILKKQKTPKDVQAVIVKNLQDPEFLVLKRLNKNSGIYEFRLVKGGIKKTEDAEGALTREITEETGVQKSTILSALEPYSYSYFLKRVYVTHNVSTYLVEAVSAEDYSKVNQAEEGGFDIDSILWLTIGDIVSTLTYPQEQDLAMQAIQYLGK